MAVDRANVSFTDGQGKSSKTSFSTNVVTSANFDATNLAVAAVVSAMQDLTDGNVKQYSVEHVQPGSTAVPANKNIMRGRKWSVTMEDQSSNRLFVMQIPTALLDATSGGDPDMDGSGNAILTSAHWSAFLTAMNSGNIKGPAGGAVVVIKAKMVTRRA